MGALAEGFAAAKQRREDELTEIQRKDSLVDRELHDLADLLGQDVKFLKDNDVVCDIGQRMLRVAHRRSPVATVHYSAESQEYTMTVMHDGSHVSSKTTDDCARTIGGLLFFVLSHKQDEFPR